MPVTPDAIKPVSDNRDFYFIVIQKNASALLYRDPSSGQNDNEHRVSASMWMGERAGTIRRG